MPIITIDNIDYDTESLSDQAKAQLANLRAVDRRIKDLQVEMAILQTARNAYSRALTEALPRPK